MNPYVRPDLEGMTVAAIKAFCRDREITGYSRYTRKSQLIQYVESVLDSIEVFLEEDLLEGPTLERDGDRPESFPTANRSVQICPDLPRSTQIHPDLSPVSPTLNETDRSVSFIVIPEGSPSYPRVIPGLSPGYPRVIPLLSSGHNPVMPELSPGDTLGTSNLSIGDNPGKIDRYSQLLPKISPPEPKIKPRLTRPRKVPALFKDRFKSRYWIAFGRIWDVINHIGTRGDCRLGFALAFLWKCGRPIVLEGGQ